MKYILNISFIFSESLEQNVVLWLKNQDYFSDSSIFRVVGKNEGALTYCVQIQQDSMLEVQRKTSQLHQILSDSLKKDFNEEVMFFMSVLESI
jgi:hypothetical protein